MSLGGRSKQHSGKIFSLALTTQPKLAPWLLLSKGKNLGDMTVALHCVLVCPSESDMHDYEVTSWKEVINCVNLVSQQALIFVDTYVLLNYSTCLFYQS